LAPTYRERSEYYLPTMTLAPGTRLGAYEVIDQLGAGGMGEVYRARDLRLAREVAIKVLSAQLSHDPAALARFEREAKAVATLSHPGILAIFDFGSADGVAYAVMELLEGETLRTRLAEGQLPARKAIEYATQIAEGLAAAHDRGIVHRDLKPENVFLTTNDRVKILDFGLARQTVIPAADETSSPTLSRHTDPGTVLGTIGYMSPEQVRGQAAGPASDIFSLGAVLYEMLTGRRAFKGDSAAETMHAILKDEPLALNETSASITPAVDRIVRHCLEKRPEQRFHSAHDVAFDLKSLVEVSGVGAGPPRRAVVERRTVLGAAALLVAVAGAVGGVVADRAMRKSPAAALNYQRLTFDRGAVNQARFAADGNAVVYSAAWRGAPSELFMTRLDGRESRLLGLPAGVLRAVSSGSELAVGLGISQAQGAGTLARVPSGGAPREVIENVTSADWSPDGAELAVVRLLKGAQRVEFPIGKVLYESSDNITHLRVSPRGDWLAFIEHPPGLDFSAGSLIAVDRSGAKRILSRDWADLFGLAWHPDGREIWFTAARRGELKAVRAVTLEGKERLVGRLLGQIDLEDITRDGRVLMSHANLRSDITVLPAGVAKERDLVWLGLSSLADLSEDGRRVLFTELPEGGGEGGFTYLRNADGSPAVRLGEGVALALSPDGKWALSMLTSPARLMLLPTGVGEPRTLISPGLTYTGWGAWLPDSRRVLFTAAAKGGASRAYVQDIEGGDPAAIGPAAIRHPTASPDGKTIAALGPDGKAVLFSIDGGEARPCPGAEQGDWPIRWGADGSLFIERAKGIGAEVHRLDVATGRLTLLRTVVAQDPAGQITPLYIQLSADGKAYAYSFLRNLSDLYVVEGLK
jgi:eukaryotic-like serine/threonine-protein kinase